MLAVPKSTAMSADNMPKILDNIASLRPCLRLFTRRAINPLPLTRRLERFYDRNTAVAPMDADVFHPRPAFARSVGALVGIWATRAYIAAA